MAQEISTEKDTSEEEISAEKDNSTERDTSEEEISVEEDNSTEKDTSEEETPAGEDTPAGVGEWISRRDPSLFTGVRGR